MEVQAKEREKKVRKLAILFAIVAVILATSTYAWFIGMRTVHVSPFDVEIAAVDQLSLSLDGYTWDEVVTIDDTSYNVPTYLTNKNWWAGKGLIPMSSIGEMNEAAGRLVLYEKASLTASPGGYRLMASPVGNENPANDEKDGYIAFDLFIRNLSGTNYNVDYEELDEEAIYMTVNSKAVVGSGGVEGTGIENSVRVAFAQIGRVKGTATEDEKLIIQGITCANDTTDPNFPVTGICGERDASIWEPNDRNHVDGAVNWYNTACKKRLAAGTDVTDKDSFSGSCGTFVDGLYYPTYAINQAITSAMNVDIYDGLEYNSYSTTSSLTKVATFTDTTKLLRGMERTPLMTLAPNSITKVRIYVWIEGQDVDNYDFAAIGKKISINFGFTKERFEEDDVDYPGPSTNEGEGPHAGDKTPPVIKLAGSEVVELNLGEAYSELTHGGVLSVEDNADTSLTIADVKISGVVNENVPGTYQIVYRVEDADNNIAVKTRSVIVKTS